MLHFLKILLHMNKFNSNFYFLIFPITSVTVFLSNGSILEE